jgi:hypothetical protein
MFSETQRFRQIWIWLLLAAIFIIRVYAYLAVKPHSHQPLRHFFIIALVIVLFFVVKLTTKIDETGICYQFFPFHVKERKIIWDDIAAVYIRKYNPLAEFGGWGIRGISNKNRALNTSGSIGIQIVYKNGNRLLLGTQKMQEADEILKRLSARGIIADKYKEAFPAG